MLEKRKIDHKSWSESVPKSRPNRFVFWSLTIKCFISECWISQNIDRQTPAITCTNPTSWRSMEVTNGRAKLSWNWLDWLCLNVHCTGCSIMIAPPSTAETSKTLAKLLLYYNSLNKVTLLCKVSDWYILFSLKKFKLLTYDLLRFVSHVLWVWRAW